MKKTTLPFGLALLLLIVVISGCVQEQPQGQETIRIGLIIGTTGSFAPYGEMMLHGAQLAAAQLNEEAGYEKVILIVEDTQSKVENAITAYQNKKELFNAFISGQSGVVLALAPLAEADKKILLNASAMTPKIRTAGDFIFSNINDSTVEVSAMAGFAYEKEGLRRMAVFYQNDEAGLTAKGIFIQSFTGLGGEVLGEESFVGDATDVRAQLMRIKQLNPDGVYLPAYPKNAGLILKQAKELGLDTKWYSWDIEGNDILAVAGGAAEDLVYSTNSLDFAKDLKTKNFAEKFQQQFGAMPTIYAATSYEAIMLLAEAAEKTDGSSEAMKNYLYGVKNWPGVSGTTTFDSDGMAIKQVAFKTVKNGEFVLYEGGLND